MPAIGQDNGRGQLLPVFLCEVCGRPASYGFGCIAGGGRTGFENGKWYCAQLLGQPACKASGQLVVVALETLGDRTPLFSPTLF